VRLIAPVLIISVVGPLLLGCATRTVHVPTPLRTFTAPPADDTYRIQPGDRLLVKYLYSPGFDEEVTVRPDGRISLPLAQELQAGGLSPADLTRRIAAKSAQQLRKPHVTVMVRSFAARQVYVAGEVGRPQLVELTGGLTVFQAITLAGGIEPTGRFRDVILIRRMPDGTPLATSVDLNSVLDGTDMAQDIFLRPRDIIYVPATRIAKANRFVQQYLRDLLPIRVGLSFSYKLNEDDDVTDDDDRLVIDSTGS
jgi:protein involved in polysaccharide export with SLBB domain